MGQYVYSDFDFGLLATEAGVFELQTNQNAINQSIQTILSTMPGERTMYPSFGSLVPQLVFSNMNSFTAHDIQEEIQSAIETWENRVELQNVEVIPDYDNNWYVININYTIITTGQDALFSGKIDAPSESTS